MARARSPPGCRCARVREVPSGCEGASHVIDDEPSAGHEARDHLLVDVAVALRGLDIGETKRDLLETGGVVESVAMKDLDRTCRAGAADVLASPGDLLFIEIDRRERDSSRASGQRQPQTGVVHRCFPAREICPAAPTSPGAKGSARRPRKHCEATVDRVPSVPQARASPAACPLKCHETLAPPSRFSNGRLRRLICSSISSGNRFSLSKT